jgi:RNA polymerase sigma-70 factor, ECF subfamily
MEKPLDLIKLAQTGDREAFAALFEQYKNLVYKTAYLILGDGPEAEDALQEVFLLVHRSIADFDPHKGAFTTWLHRITVNYCINCRRKHSLLTFSIDQAHITSVNDFPGERLADEEAAWQAIRKLRPRQQAVVVLRFYWDLPYAEIAYILGVPLGTIKSRLGLALKTLRKTFEESETLSGPVPEVEVCK